MVISNCLVIPVLTQEGTTTTLKHEATYDRYFPPFHQILLYTLNAVGIDDQST